MYPIEMNPELNQRLEKYSVIKKTVEASGSYCYSLLQKYLVEKKDDREFFEKAAIKQKSTLDVPGCWRFDGWPPDNDPIIKVNGYGFLFGDDE